MTDQVRKRPFRFKNTTPADPAIRRFWDWLPENRGFYQDFRLWLKGTGYSDVSVHLYGVAARQAIGFLDKPYWVIDPENDLELVRQHLQARSITDNTRADYYKGLLKLAEYLRFRCHRPPKQPKINWAYYLATLPDWLQADIRSFAHHSQRAWKPERFAEKMIGLLSSLTMPLRWIVQRYPFNQISDLTPQVWDAYLDSRLANGVHPKTVNHELSRLKALLCFLQEHDRPVCERFLLLDFLDEGDHLPRDVPVEYLRRLQQQIQTTANAAHVGLRRMGRMDLAWFLLMLHGGLRTCEVRSLRLQDIDWERCQVRIEQSKGLKDRLVYLSQAAIAALWDYLEVRGPGDALPDECFVFRHAPLTACYCFERLRTYCKKSGLDIHITPHQLRHSFATLLLNAGAPVLTVQNLLGHKWIDTTLGYARLYDGTIAADYYQAMTLVERRLALPEDALTLPPGVGQLIALVDSLRDGTLNPTQSAAVRQLRAGILALAELKETIEDVKVPAPLD